MVAKTKKDEEEGGFGSILKKLHITEDVPESGEKAVESAEASTSESQDASAAIETTKNVAVDERAKQVLLEAIAQKGPALKQFFELVTSFIDIIEDEGKRFLAAKRALEKQGMNVDEVEEGIRDQLSALDEERVKFNQTLADELQTISQRQKEVEKLGSQIIDYQKKIKDLESQKKILAEKVVSDRQKLDRNKAGFEAAARAVESEIKELSAKIKSVKGGK